MGMNRFSLTVWANSLKMKRRKTLSLLIYNAIENFYGGDGCAPAPEDVECIKSFLRFLKRVRKKMIPYGASLMNEEDQERVGSALDDKHYKHLQRMHSTELVGLAVECLLRTRREGSLNPTGDNFEETP